MQLGSHGTCQVTATTTTTTLTTTTMTTTTTATTTATMTTAKVATTKTTKSYLLPYFAFGIQDFTHYLFLPGKTFDLTGVGSRKKLAQDFHFAKSGSP